MPLIETTVNSLKADIANAPSEDIFLVLSSAKDETGETWCIYCSLIEDEVDQVFGKEENCKHLTAGQRLTYETP